MDNKAIEYFEAGLDHYCAEGCNMNDPQVVLSLLEAYALRKGDCQLVVLLYQAHKMLTQFKE